jgi:hypothetical protein
MKLVEKLMLEMMAEVVVLLHIVDMWLGGGGLEIWCGLTEKKMKGGGEGLGKSGGLGMREPLKSWRLISPSFFFF